MNIVKKNSGVGIASFIINLVGITILGFVLMYVSMLNFDDLTELKLFNIGFTAIIFMTLFSISFGLGIGGIFIENSKKTLAIIGTVSSAIIMFFFYLSCGYTLFSL